MALIADTGAIYSLYDAEDAYHDAVSEVVDGDPGPILVPMALLAEIDYLLREHLGVRAELDFLDSLKSGALGLEPLTPEDLKRCRELVSRYRDMELGLADAAVVATAERRGIYRLLTLDQRHFRVVRSKSGKPFTILPADRPE